MYRVFSLFLCFALANAAADLGKMQRTLQDGGCSVSRSGLVFTLSQCCSIKTVMNGLKETFRSEPNANIPNIKDATRNFVDPETFSVCGTVRFSYSPNQQQDTAAAVNVMLSRVANGRSSSPLLSWLSIKQVTIGIDINVDLASDKEATMALLFTNTEFSADLQGDHFPSVPGLKVQITKEDAYDDIHYTILQHPALDMSLEDFLKGIGVKNEYMLETLDFRIRGPIKGIVAEGLWNVIIYGDSFTQQVSELSRRFYSDENAFLFCQYNEEDKKGPKCSLNSQNIPGADFWSTVTSIDMAGNFFGASLSHSPINVFQISKVELDIAFSKEIKQKLLPLSEKSFSLPYAMKKNRIENQDYISAGKCVRFLRDSFAYSYSSGSDYRSSNIGYIFNICIKQDSVSATTLPAFSIPLATLIMILIHQPIRAALYTVDDRYGVIVESMTYTNTLTCAKFKSLIEKHHEFIKGHMLFDNAVITVCGNENTATISAEGREKVLDADASVDAKLMKEFYEDDPAAAGTTNGFFLTGNVKIFDIGYVLEKTGQNFISNYALEFFPSFKQFGLKDTVFKAPSTSQLYLILEGSTFIKQNNFKFELVSRSEDNGNGASLALCLTKEGGTSDEIFSIFYKEKYKEIPYSFEKTVISVSQDNDFYTKHKASGTGVALRCQDVEINYKEEGTTIIGSYFGDVHAMLSGLIFGCNAGGEGSKKSSSCQVIKNGFGGEEILDAKYYGRVATRELRLVSLIKKPFIIADGIEISSDGLQHVLVQNTNDEVQGRFINQLAGKLDLGSYKPTVSISFGDDNAIIQIHKVYQNEVNFNLYGINGISQTEIYKDPAAMSPTRWSSLEMQGNIKLGTAPGFEIDIEDLFEGRARQFLYQDSAKYKFFACAPIEKEFLISNIVQAFGVTGGSNLFSSTIMKEVCVAYHNDESDWNIESQGFKAKKGLRLYGTITSLFGSNHLKANIKLDGDVQAFIEMPVLKFGAVAKENPGSGKRETRYSFKMSKTKSLEEYGPTLSAKFNNFQNYGAVTITGHIKLPLFEGQITLRLTGNGAINQDIELTNSESGSTKFKPGKINLLGQMILGPYMQNSYFVITVDLLLAAQQNVLEGCKKEFEKINERSALELSEIGVQHTKVLSDISSLEEKMLLVNGDSLKRSIQQLEKEMFLEIRKVQKQNQESCKPLKLSGFKLDRSCGKRNSLQNSTCLKFAKDAFDATDTTCLEESQKIREIAHENALKKNTVIRASSLSLREKRTCYNLFEQIIQHYKNAEEALSTAKETDLPTKISSLETLGENFDIRVTDFSTVSPLALNNAPNPLCISFSIGYQTAATNVFENERLCVVDTMFDDLGKKIVKDFINGIEDERDRLFKDAIKKAAEEIYKANFLKRKNEKDYEQCKQIGRARKRENVFVPEFFRSGYKNQALRTNVERMESLANYFAPWNVMKRNNPMKVMSNLKPNSHQRINHVKGGSPCSEARAKIDNYGTMVDYIKTWVDNYQKGLAEFKKINENIVRGLKKRNMTLHKGYTEFMEETQSQLNQLNTFAPSYMKNELNALINPKQKDPLENYLSQTSSVSSNVIKKSFPQNDGIFNNLSNMLIQHFSGNKTLDEMAPSIKQMEGMVVSLNKGSLVCHDEL